MVRTNSTLTAAELNVIRQITSIQLEVNRRLVSFLEMKQASLSYEMIALLEPLERDTLESQIVGLYGYLQREKNQRAFFTTLCKNLSQEQTKQYTRDSIFMLRQALRLIRKRKRQSLAPHT